MAAITIRVPASVSNLGPGFDCLGVALRLYNLITLERTSKRDFLPPTLSEAARLFFRRAGRSPFLFSGSIKEGLPRSRGLGSSATVRLGVLHGLNHLSGSPLDRDQLFRLCADLEGHPDNAAPASFGGFTVARLEMVQRFDVSSRLKFVVLIPDHEINTDHARRILPRQIVRTRAVKSCGDACAITAAFVSQNYRLMQGNFGDEFHQPFRARLVPYLGRVIRAAEQAGALGAFLSGSGSSVAAIALEKPRKVADAMSRAIGKLSARVVVLSADNEGAKIVRRKR
jgi:homoserine kinase